MKKVLEVQIDGNSKGLDVALNKAESDLKAFTQKMKDIGKDMTAFISVPLLAAGGASIKFATDLEETINKVNVVFGNAAKSVKDFGKTAQSSFGLTENQALDLASTFGDMATSMGYTQSDAAKLSLSLVSLAGDLQSFKNIPIQEVFTSLNGIFTGETESLKRLGVVMTEANLQTFALTQGISKQLNEMSQAEKVALRYQYVINVTKNAQGDFARTMQSSANQQRDFKNNITALSTEIGRILLPMFTDLLKGLNNIARGFRELGDGTKTIIVTLGGLAALSGPLLFLAGTIIPKVIQGFVLMRSAVKLLNLELAGKAGLVGLLGLAAISAYNYVSEINKYKGLSDEQKKDADAIRKNNIEIYNQIAALQKLRQTATDFVTGPSTALTKSQIDAQIAGLRGTLMQNRKLKAGIPAPSIAQPSATKPGKSALSPEERKAIEQRQIDAIKLESDAFDERIKAYKTNEEDLQKSREQAAKFTNLIGGTFLQGPIGGATKSLQELGSAMREALWSDDQLQGIKSTESVMNTSLNNMQFALQQSQESWNQYYQGLQVVQSGLQSIFASIGQSIINSFGQANTILGQIIRQLASVIVQLGAMALAEKLFSAKSIAASKSKSSAQAIQIGTQAAASKGPAGLALLAPFIASAMGIVSAAFSAVPKFANGGIISGPTMGLMGEYPGAKSNPEVIAPLSKLKDMIGGDAANVNLNGEFVVRGQDLILALQRAEKNYNRIG